MCVRGTREDCLLWSPFLLADLGVIFLLEYSVPIPEDVAEKVQVISQHMGIRVEAVILFAVIRFLEIQNWILKLWR